MARMVLMKIITIALAVYIICLSDFFLPPEDDIVNVLMVACIDLSLSNKVTNLPSPLGFMNITSITNCSQNGTQRRMTEIKVSLNHSSNEKNQGKTTCQNVTPHFLATGWFICKTDRKEKHTLNQESPPQVSKMVISVTDRSIITGVSGLRIRMFPFPKRINATWSYSSANGMKTTRCYMEVQFQNSTIENLTDQNNDLCTKKNCNHAVKRDVDNDPCYKNTTNYLAMTIKDTSTNTAEPSPESIHVAWNIYSPDGMQSTKCFTHVQLQNSTDENQEQNCVLEIIWLALFPTICVILLIFISYQWFKEDSSCNALNCRSSSDCPQEENTEEHGYETVLISGAHIITSPPNSSKQQNSDGASADEYVNLYPAVNGASLTPHHPSGAHIITSPPDSSKRQNSDGASADEYVNVHPALNGASLTPHHPSGMQDSIRLYGNIQQPNSESAPADEYANFLDPAVNAAFLTHHRRSAVPSLGPLPKQARNVAAAAGNENLLSLTSDTPDLRSDHSHSTNAAACKKKRTILCL